MKKFRVSYTYAAYDGGFDTYWSGSFSKSGTWYEKWNAPTARVHEDMVRIIHDLQGVGVLAARPPSASN